MDKDDELERLRHRAQALEESIDDIEREIERATHDLAAGGDPGRVIDYLRERHNAQLGLMYDFGKVEARLEDLEKQTLEHHEQPQERQLAQQWQDNQPIAQEDHLDWFKQSLAENPPQMDDVEIAEQRMVDDMERESVPEDHLDWLSDRR
ncbi:DUF3375 family protein [Mesorhizobium sp. M0984]|uniref:hypothetical protein n=1 Tax=Mesorhizobium sp. M0984 TaxID=2957041 RepID=UPI00333C7AF8